MFLSARLALVAYIKLAVGCSAVIVAWGYLRNFIDRHERAAEQRAQWEHAQRARQRTEARLRLLREQQERQRRVVRLPLRLTRVKYARPMGVPKDN